MRKILVAVVISLLMIGTIAAPVLATPPKTIAISWIESAVRYSYDGIVQNRYTATDIGPLDFLRSGKSYHVVNIAEVYSIPVTDIRGSLVISGSGVMSGEITYVRVSPVHTLVTLRDRITGRVTVDPDTGTMIGTYTQYRQAYGSREQVLDAYPYAIPDKSPNARGWWFLDYTVYQVTPQP